MLGEELLLRSVIHKSEKGGNEVPKGISGIVPECSLLQFNELQTSEPLLTGRICNIRAYKS